MLSSVELANECLPQRKPTPERIVAVQSLLDGTAPITVAYRPSLSKERQDLLVAVGHLDGYSTQAMTWEDSECLRAAIEHGDIPEAWAAYFTLRISGLLLPDWPDHCDRKKEALSIDRHVAVALGVQ
jgi:hypothetical protein